MGPGTELVKTEKKKKRKEKIWIYPELELRKFSQKSSECERMRRVKLKAKIKRTADVQTFLHRGILRGFSLPQLIPVWVLFAEKGGKFYSRLPR